MTNEEAIIILNNTAWLGTHEDSNKTEQAVRIAIEALKTQPKLQAQPKSVEVNLMLNQEQMEYILAETKKQLSGGNTTFEWIPCKDRLPEINGEYLVTAETNNGLEVYQDTYWAECMWDDSGDKVIAWAKMPEPYTPPK